MQNPTLARSTATSRWKKPLSFGLWAALGCLIAALVGEVWLAMTQAPPPPPPPPPPPAPPQAIVLVLDTSYSMDGGSLDEMKRAATDYIGRQNLNNTRLAVVGFDSQSRVATVLSRDSTSLKAGVASLEVHGLTRMDLGLTTAVSLLPPAPVAPLGATPDPTAERRSILLFTDGYPESGDFEVDAVAETRKAADLVRRSGIRLVAVGTRDADQGFLGELTGDPGLVFSASAGQFAEAFKQAERALSTTAGRAVLESAPISNYDAAREWMRAAIWTGLIGLGAALALLIAQGIYARQSVGITIYLGVLTGFVAGVIAGGLGQWLFTQVGDTPMALAMGRLISWALGGALLGLGMAPFVPNLAPFRAAVAGALGGWAGAIAFALAAYALGDTAGRLLGAALLGFAIGAAVVLAEVAFRKAWLHVSYGPKDAFDLNLGGQPIAVGSDRAQCRIFAREIPEVAARYGLENGRPYVEDAKGARQNLTPGDKRRFGNVEITLLTEGVSIAPPAEPPAPMPIPQPPTSAWGTPSTTFPAPPTVVAAAPMAPTKWRLEGPIPVVLPASGTVQVGRVDGNTIVLPDPGVSSRHATLTVGPQSLEMTDLGSTNGTFVNGTRLGSGVLVALKAGDQVVFGRVTFVVSRS